MTPDYDYSLYGLRVRSSAPLDGLTPLHEDGAVDLTLHHQQTPPDLPLNSPRWRIDPDFTYADDAPAEARAQPLVWSDDGQYMQWRFRSHIALIFSRDGREIYARWSAGVTPAMRAFNIYGPGIGMLFKLRHRAVLHASVIAVGGRAIAFAGASGAGKSTLAAAFDQAGYPIVSDDLCILNPDPDTGGFLVPPGVPRVRLLPDAAHALYRGAEDGFVRSADGIKLERMVGWADGSGVGHALPLAGVYLIIGRQGSYTIDAVPPHQALFALAGGMYLQFVGSPATRAVTFGAASQLVKQVPIAALVTPHGHEKLKKLCHAIAARHSS